jgi:hypothetical protein
MVVLEPLEPPCLVVFPVFSVALRMCTEEADEICTSKHEEITLI